MICPRKIVNHSQAGSVYVVVHRGRDDTQWQANTRKHYSLAIDITGILRMSIIIYFDRLFY